MTPLRLNRALQSLRRTTALVALVCALGGIVALEHSGIAGMHGAEMTAFCLAVVPAAFLAARRQMRARSPWLQVLRALKPVQAMTLTTQAPLARAGPPNLLVLRL